MTRRNDDETDLPVPLQEPPEWLTPWNYPSRVTDELAVAIATEIVYGADIRAAGMKHGVAPSRLMRWLRWGEEAYNRDADGNDQYYDYLNLFLKVMQAAGMALAPAQREAYTQSPQWWLSHSPDHRGGWGQQGQPAEQLGSGAVEADAVDTTSASPLEAPSPDAWKRILRTIVTSGALVEKEDTQVDTTTGSERDGEVDAG